MPSVGNCMSVTQHSNVSYVTIYSNHCSYSNRVFDSLCRQTIDAHNLSLPQASGACLASLSQSALMPLSADVGMSPNQFSGPHLTP